MSRFSSLIYTPSSLVSIGGVMTFWAIRDLAFPPISREPGKEVNIDFSRLAVTKREREIIGLILGGGTNASIADELFISESTVKKHIDHIFRKLGIASRWELLKVTGNVHPKA
jgi:DNA-binding NarL/FixJ family response regulator